MFNGRMRTLTCSLLLMFAGTVVGAQRGGPIPPPPNRPLASLKGVTPPRATGLELYVKDQAALTALGKAFFWDMQTGSDGHTACATCHFHAGADHRLQNQLSGADATINRVLSAEDFPFHQFANPADNRGGLIRNLRQVAGSMGVVERSFVDIQPGDATDVSNVVSPASQFHVKGIQVRQVTGRNTP